MLIQEYNIYQGYNSLSVPPSSKFMAVREKYGTLYAYFMIDEQDFSPQVTIELEVTNATGNVPEGAYVDTITFNDNHHHVFMRGHDDQG